MKAVIRNILSSRVNGYNLSLVLCQLIHHLTPISAINWLCPDTRSGHNNIIMRLQSSLRQLPCQMAMDWLTDLSRYLLDLFLIPP